MRQRTFKTAPNCLLRLRARVNPLRENFCLATAVLHYLAAAVTDRGCKRPSNEDAFGFSVEDGFYVVCDGMGGAAAGEIASSVAVDEVLHMLAYHQVSAQPFFLRLLKKPSSPLTMPSSLAPSANQRLNEKGTTMAALAVEESRAWVLNIGDSRCYRLPAACRLEQLTLDHSLVEEQVSHGPHVEH